MRGARVALLGLVLAALAGGIVYVRLPNAAACVASGRTIERDNRYCVGAGGSVLMREHVVAHATDPIICLPVALGVGLLVFLAVRGGGVRARATT